MDIDCGSFLQSNLEDAFKSDHISNETINKALMNLFKVQFRLGLFDPAEKQPYMKIPTDVVNSAFHQELALEASRQGLGLYIQNLAVTLYVFVLALRNDFAQECQQTSSADGFGSCLCRRDRPQWGKLVLLLLGTTADS